MRTLSPHLRKGFARSALIISLWEPPPSGKLLKEGALVSYAEKPHVVSDCYCHWPTESMADVAHWSFSFCQCKTSCISLVGFTHFVSRKAWLAESASTYWRPAGTMYCVGGRASGSWVLSHSCTLGQPEDILQNRCLGPTYRDSDSISLELGSALAHLTLSFCPSSSHKTLLLTLLGVFQNPCVLWKLVVLSSSYLLLVLILTSIPNVVPHPTFSSLIFFLSSVSKLDL